MEAVFVLLAAGSGERLGSKVPKALVNLNGTPIFIHSLIRSIEAGVFSQFILVVPEDFKSDFKSALSEHGVSVDNIVSGGARRVDSVSNAVKMAADLDCLFIHDAARPFLSTELIISLFEEAKSHPALIPSLAVNSTVKLSKDSFVLKTLSRDNLYTVQTPQVFDLKLFKSALLRFNSIDKGEDIPDDAYLLELSKKKVKLVEGDIFNFKITYPQDLELAERILKRCR
jgi:2-C-methyl-D-erythritol 4-phosphate cytidylyltransferase